MEKGDQSLSPEEITKFSNLFGMLKNDSDHILGDYLDTHMPGFRATDPLPAISPLLAARDPGTVVLSHFLIILLNII